MAQIFISYAREDFPHAKSLYERLAREGFRPWMDKVDLLAGQPWQPALERAMRESDFFVLLLSRNSVKKRGFVQREIRTALDLWEEKLAEDIFLIPVMLEAMDWEEVPEAISKFQWVELYEDDGWERLARSLSHGVTQRELKTNPPIIQTATAMPAETPAVKPPVIEAVSAPQVKPPIIESPPPSPPPTPAPKKQQPPPPQAKPLPNKISDSPSKTAPTSAYARMAAQQRIPVFARLYWWVLPSLLVIPTVVGIGYWMSRESTPPTKPPAVSEPSPVASVSPKSVAQGQQFTETIKGVQLEMISVPGGSFQMGSPAGQGYDAEHPQHRVTVPGLYLGKTEVTQALWQAVMGSNPSSATGDLQRPVESVSWNESKEFCTKLKQLTGKDYRLPSEAEWEYACRAGTTGDYAGELDAMAWYGKNSGDTTHPVGQKQANRFGLYDMHGNVWEWCEDVWHENYKGAPSDGSAWLSGGDSSRRVLRGGSFYYVVVRARSAYRNRGAPGGRNFAFGLRVALSARTP